MLRLRVDEYASFKQFVYQAKSREDELAGVQFDAILIIDYKFV
jgi:hypothetical protein